MQTYLVGGAVRDALMGLPGQDRDWVVVGTTAQALLDQGFLPVGRDFPVFLHPGTQEEYALARTERKTAPGYRGFVVHAAPQVTLEEDLARRDLTINSIAVSAYPKSARGIFRSNCCVLQQACAIFDRYATQHAPIHPIARPSAWPGSACVRHPRCLIRSAQHLISP